MEAFFILLPLFLPIALLVLGGLVGQATERSHLSDLAGREHALAHIVVTDLRQAPAGMPLQSGGQFVMGSVVVASDYFKRFIAGFRNLIGGELDELTPVMDRGRREARLRMLEEAVSTGATLVINVRFETSEVALGAAEVICYGTALRAAPAA